MLVARHPPHKTVRARLTHTRAMKTSSEPEVSSVAGALATSACGYGYQLNCSFKFIRGWPPMLDVRWSALILPKVFGLRKSTVVVGGFHA
jgi:hypothetical protein